MNLWEATHELVERLEWQKAKIEKELSQFAVIEIRGVLDKDPPQKDAPVWVKLRAAGG